MHADPNFANFAFREDGAVIVYDYGCVKAIRPDIATAYAGLMNAVIGKRKAVIPGLLHGMGVFKKGGVPLARDVTDPYVDLAQDIVRTSPPYTFGEDNTIYEALYELGMANLQEATDIRFPSDAIFIDRTLVGLFGNLSMLGATGPWRKLIQKYTAVPGSARKTKRRRGHSKTAA